jgi:DNA topoisomerase-1
MSRRSLPIATCAPEELARIAKLRYVNDEASGFSRHGNGRGFCYCNGRGSRLRDARQLKRIESLAIPPAWTDVWICSVPDGHLQATGRDNRHRKQYIYHARWRDVSNLVKFIRLCDCATLLPRLRRNVTRDLRGRGLTRNRVLAGMVALLDLTSIRIGNEEYVRQNNSYGLATLRTRHVTIRGRRAELRFRAKGGIPRRQVVDDPRLVRLLKQLIRLRGAHVFQYLADDGKTRSADAIAVNEYLRERTGSAFTAKDFRTWKASALAAGGLFRSGECESPHARKRVIKGTIAEVAEALGNTPTVCRNYYIHPGLLEAYEEGKFLRYFDRFVLRTRRSLSRDELVLAHFLGKWTPRAPVPK